MNVKKTFYGVQQFWTPSLLYYVQKVRDETSLTARRVATNAKRYERRKEPEMKSNIIVNAIENTISVSKSFYKRASVYGSAEYAELRRAMLENPSFHIEFKTSEKKTYNGLTFKIMEDYIKTQPDSEDILMKFEAVQRIAKAKGSLYPLTKKWFLSNYPAYKVNEVADAETTDETARIAEEKKKEAEGKAVVELEALAADTDLNDAA